MPCFASSVLLVLAAASATSAHMQLSKPYPYNSPLNPNTPESKKDYSMTSPLVGDGPYPCKGFIGTADQGKRESWTAGDTVGISMAGSAVHGGGSCQFSLSYDNGANFHVIESYIGGCMTDSLNFDVQIPSSVPAGKDIIFSWSWFNKVGNREMYQNCFAVDIASQSTTPLTTPTIFVANVNVNQCSTVEGTPVVFPSPGDVVKYGGEYAGKSIGSGLQVNAGVVGDNCFAPGSVGAGSGGSANGGSETAPAPSSAAAPTSSKAAAPSSSKAAAPSSSKAAAPPSSSSAKPVSSSVAGIPSSSVAGIPVQSSAVKPSSSAYVASSLSSSKASVASSSSSSKAWVASSASSQQAASSKASSAAPSAKSSLPAVAAHVSIQASSSAAAPLKSSGFSSAVAPVKASSSVAVILPSSAKPTPILITSTVPVQSPKSSAPAAASSAASGNSSPAVNAKAAGQPCQGDSWACDGQILNRCSYGSWVTITDCAAQSGVVCSAGTPVGCVWPWQAATAKKRDFSSSRHIARGQGSHGKGHSRKRLVPNGQHSHQQPSHDDDAGVEQ